MDPATLMAVSAVATLAGGGISAYGAMQGGQAQKAYYDYQAGVQETLAKIATLKGTRDIAAGEQEAQRYGIQTAQQLGGINVRGGAGNVQVGNVGPTTMSTAQAYLSQHAVGVEEQASARQTAAERAYGENVEAASKIAGAGAMRMAGAQAIPASELAAAGDVVSAVGSASGVAAKWYQTSPSSAPPAVQTAGDPLQIAPSYYQG